jgi:predicted oxidoreductase
VAVSGESAYEVLSAASTPSRASTRPAEYAGIGGGDMYGYNALEGTFLGGCKFRGRTAARAVSRALGCDSQKPPRLL